MQIFPPMLLDNKMLSVILLEKGVRIGVGRLDFKPLRKESVCCFCLLFFLEPRRVTHSPRSWAACCRHRGMELGTHSLWRRWMQRKEMDHTGEELREREKREAARLSETCFWNGVEWACWGASFSVWLKNTQQLHRADAQEFNDDFGGVSELSRSVLSSGTLAISPRWPRSPWKIARPNWDVPSVQYRQIFKILYFQTSVKYISDFHVDYMLNWFIYWIE